MSPSFEEKRNVIWFLFFKNHSSCCVENSLEWRCWVHEGWENNEATAVIQGRGTCGWVCSYCGGGEKLSGSGHVLLVTPKGLAEGSNVGCESERGICYDFKVRPEQLKGWNCHLWGWISFHAFSSVEFSAAPLRGPRLYQQLLWSSAGQREGRE